MSWAAGVASFAAGTTTGYQFAQSGGVTPSKAGILSRASTASSDRRAIINGQPYVHIANGLWAGYWIAESQLVLAAGSHTGYRFSVTGTTTGSKTTTAPSLAAVASTSWLEIGSTRYWYVASGTWAGYWIAESSGFRPRARVPR